MIEMLGVLAVIGVLSVGGVYGYRQAMFMYHKSKSLQIIDMAALAVKEQGENPDSIFDDERSTQLFCENYLGNHPTCKHLSLVDNYGNLFNWENSQNQGAYWEVYRIASDPWNYTCTSDISLKFGRIPINMCGEILSVLKTHYSDAEIAALSSYGGATLLSETYERLYQIHCKSNAAPDTSSLVIAFKVPASKTLGDTCACPEKCHCSEADWR